MNGLTMREMTYESMRRHWMCGIASIALLGSAPAFAAADVTGGAAESDRDSIVVTGQTAEGNSLEISSDHKIDVVTAEALARAPDSNMAEALARLPGIALVPVTTGGALGGSAFMIDDAARGEGGYVSVRGLGPDYTLNQLNGTNVAQGKPATRQVSLSLLPPLGFARVAVSKAATASMDGDSIAGIVDFQDPTAFDIGKALTMISVQGSFSQNNADYNLHSGPFNAGGVAQGEISRIFGDGAFGVHAVGYYAKRHFSSSVFNENEGSWDFLRTLTGSDHSPVTNIDPTKNLIGEQLNAQLSYGTTTRWGGNASLDWQGDNSTFFLRGSYAKASTQQTTIQRGPQATNTDAVDNGDGTFTTIENHIVGTYWAETNPEEAELANLQLGSETTIGRLHVRVLGFGSYARDDRPNHIEVAYKNFNLDPSASLVPTYQGNPAYPVPNLSSAQITEINNLSGYAPQTDDNFGSAGVVRSTVRSNQLLGGGKLDLDWQTGWDFLPKIRFGAKLSISHRYASSRDYQYDTAGGLPGLATTLNSSPFLGRSLPSPMVGDQGAQFPFVTPLFNSSAALKYILGLPLSFASASYGAGWTDGPAAEAFNNNANTQSANERVFSTYVDAPMHFGGIEVTPGFRFEHTNITNRFWSETFADDGSPQSGSFQSNSTHYDQPLPSLFISWRPDPALVVRADYWKSYVRPSLFLLGGGRQITSLGDGVIQIQEGNPALKPVTSHNFDVSIEWGHSEDSHFSVAGFYKMLDDYLFDAGSSSGGDGTHFINTSSSVQADPVTVLLQPRNGGRARAYGLEISGSQRLAFLPGPLAHFYLAGNATLQHTEADLHLSGIRDGGPMQYAPKIMANASLSYRTSRLDATLSYRYTGKFLETYYTYRQDASVSGAAQPNLDISWWDQPTQRLDFSLRYVLTENIELGFAAQNLTNEASYYATRGKDSPLIPQIVQPGRIFSGSVAVRF